MKYLYLLYADESKMPAPGSPQFDAQNAAFNAYFEDINSKGVFKAGEPVQGSSSSKTVRVRNGSTDASSGPFNKSGDQPDHALRAAGAGLALQRTAAGGWLSRVFRACFRR